MIDKRGKNLSVGDYVRYMHNRDGHSQKSDIAKIANIDDVFARLEFTNRNGTTDYCLRSKSGVTKLTDSEAMLYIFEKNA